jgi:hypothetical protein
MTYSCVSFILSIILLWVDSLHNIKMYPTRSPNFMPKVLRHLVVSDRVPHTQSLPVCVI